MEISCRVYRPRRARESPLFRLVEQHLEEFLRVYQERFAKVHGPLRPVVERVLRAFLTCGLVERGFARGMDMEAQVMAPTGYLKRVDADDGGRQGCGEQERSLPLLAREEPRSVRRASLMRWERREPRASAYVEAASGWVRCWAAAGVRRCVGRAL